jgi:hypothetical protein
VLLTTNYRQRHDPEYQGILGRILKGDITAADVQLLKSRIISRNLIPPKDTPMVVNRNALRIMLNDHYVAGVSKRANTKVTDIIAIDSCKHESLNINHPDVKEKLLQIPDHKTQSLPGILRIFVGMRCMITSNIHTSSGLSNGSFATVEYVPDERSSNGFPRYILLRLSTPPKHSYPGLPKGVVPIFPISGSFMVAVENKKKASISIRRKQFPIIPAYALTDYKSQGDTMNSVLLDIRKPPTGTWAVFFAIYVLLSRVSKLSGLYFMHDFDESVLYTKPPKSLKSLMTTLQRLDAATKLKFERK